MYTLVLTPEERRAIDWIGNRYSNGYDLFSLLWPCAVNKELDWNEECSIEFSIPENVAWEIRDNAIEEGNGVPSWPCFSSELTNKMNTFCEAIV